MLTFLIGVLLLLYNVRGQFTGCCRSRVASAVLVLLQALPREQLVVKAALQLRQLEVLVARMHVLRAGYVVVAPTAAAVAAVAPSMIAVPRSSG